MDKHIFLILLLLIVGCSRPINEKALIKEPIDYKKMLVKDSYGVFNTKNTNKPYSGNVFSLYVLMNEGLKGLLMIFKG